MYQNLFELLRQRRNEIAKETKVEPFMVFHNSVLREIAEKRPTSLKELSKIKGIGEKKLAKYGKFLLEMVNDYSHTTISNTPTEKVFTVSEYIDFLNEILIPQRAVIQGEVNQIKKMTGYSLFTLIDKTGEGVLNCFVLRSTLNSFGVELKEGLELKVEGFPKILKSGRFSFEVDHIGLVGEGALKQAFEALKKKLVAAGFFEVERKKQIPQYIQRIGLITSAFGDAKNDFLTHLGKFGFKIYFYDVRVEGLYAIDDITSAIRWFNENMSDVEVLVLTRGGGSLESLQPFNSETIAKSVFGSRVPIITAIGHENNETIADLVADVYASTPTHAARILSDPWRDIERSLSFYETHIVSNLAQRYANIERQLWFFESGFMSAITKMISFKEKELDSLQTRLAFSFQSILEKVKSAERDFFDNLNRLRIQLLTIKQRLTNQEDALLRETERWIRSLLVRLSNLEEGLRLSDPLGRLKQGYSIVFNLDNNVIKSSKQVKVGQKLNLRFYKGSAISRVEETKSSYDKR